MIVKERNDEGAGGRYIFKGKEKAVGGSWEKKPKSKEH